MRTPPPTSIVYAGLAVGMVSTALSAHAQFWSDYTIQRLGLFGPEHTSSTGRQNSTASVTADGYIVGRSTRYVGTTMRGSDAWIWDGSSTVQLGFRGPGYTADNGRQNSFIARTSSDGLVAGGSDRYAADQTYLGRDAWVWNDGVYQRVGLTGGPYAGSEGYESASPLDFLPSGQLLGESYRISGVNTSNGRDLWIWDGESTQQIGLFGEGYVGTSGIQSSTPSTSISNQSGLVLGTSTRYKGENTENGSDPWIYDPQTRTTTRLGLTGEGYTGSEGYRLSDVRVITSHGLVAGTTQQVAGVQDVIGNGVWLWDGHSQRQLVGFRDPSNIDPNGGSSDNVTRMNNLGQVAGTTRRNDASGGFLGSDAWLWDGSQMRRLGYIGTGYTTPAGYRTGGALFLNQAGQAAGHSDRYGADNLDYLGRDAWVWTGAETIQLGFTDSIYVRSDGYRQSTIDFQTESGYVAGSSQRHWNGNQWPAGSDTWIWNGSFTYQIGLRGGVYTNSDTFQQSRVLFLSESGQASGVSLRFTSAGAANGQDAWVWDGSTTRQIGLTGGAYTSSTGKQYSNILFANASGCLVGVSNTNEDDSTGGIWYYDPSTGQQHTVAASGTPTLLRDDGVLIGTYTNSTRRPFVYHPDFGLIDLVSLADGGIAAQGWRFLDKIVSVGDNFQSFVGLGFVTGQPGSSTALDGSVFLMQSPVCAECPADFDNNGGIDGGDLAAFFEDFETSGRCADVDGNGGVDGGDVAYFFLAFEQGGC